MRFDLLIAGAGLLGSVSTAQKPSKFVNQKDLIKDVKLKNLIKGSEKLQRIADKYGGNRAFGGGGHNATTEWLYDSLKKYGDGYWEVYKQPFTELFTAATVKLTVAGAEVKADYLTYGPSADNVKGNLVKVSNIGCDAADYPAGVSNNIALISRGICTFAIKAAAAKAAGAAGAIIYNNVPSQPLSGTLGGDGNYAPVKNAVRVSLYGGEEFGKLGSFHYLKTLNGSISGGPEEVAKIRAYLNFDMIASPNYVYGIYDGDGSAFNFSGPAGSDTIEKDFEKFYEANGQAHVPSLFTLRSDYAAFLENGIPSGGLFTGAEELKTEEEAALFGGTAGVALDVCYHQKCDDINNLNHEAYLLNTQSIANSVAKYAMSWEGIPRPNATLRKRDAGAARFAARSDKGGHEHNGQPCSSGHDEL
ncbi:hypothetical protein EJ07DRAFT_184015 [Lizonia empirigonia]|nr:hypothetical protein EJ07DRAFT_184015 [Lizonia empirigonia]